MTVPKKFLAGTRFHDLTVLEEAPPRLNAKGSPVRFLSCQCVCGIVKDFRLADLKKGASKSCGCLRNKVSQARAKPIEIGKRYGKLVITGEGPKPVKGRTAIVCCDCGTQDKPVSLYHLRHGIINSCGCAQPEAARKAKTTHGLSYSPLSTTLKNMVQRCYNSNSEYYSEYGGRGIKICKEWREGGLAVFGPWALSNGWEPGLEIDRIRVNEGYSPNNCRFVTDKKQANNKRSTLWVYDRNERLSFTEYHERHGKVLLPTALNRFHAGWDLHRAMTEPTVREKAALKYKPPVMPKGTKYARKVAPFLRNSTDAA